MSWDSEARYTVLTWDCVLDQYTEQEGMTNPSIDVTLSGLRRALRELRDEFGYECHRVRDAHGHYDSDAAVLVERTDDAVIDAINFEGKP